MVEKQVACPHCRGTGAENPFDIVTCRQCNGKGRTTRRVDLGNGYYNIFTQACPRCGGKGKVIGKKCHLCHEQKIIPGIEEFTLKVNAGAESNSHLRYVNMGDERMIGAPSDIVFFLAEIPHPRFVRQGHDLHTTVEISLQEALLGFEREIQLLDGRTLKLEEKGVTQPGNVRVVEGEGMPLANKTKGTLYVETKVRIESLSQEKREKIKAIFDE